MDIAAILVLAGALVFLAHFFSWLFSFTSIPNVLLLILVGIILGPLLGVLKPEYFGEAGSLFSLVALAVILFEGGIDLRLDVIRKAWKSSLKLTVTSFVLTMLIVGLAAMFIFDLDPLLAFMLGSIVSGTASVVVIPIIEQLKISSGSHTTILLEAAFTDVLSIVVTIALLRAYELGNFSVTNIGLEIVISFIAAAIIGVAGGFAWSILLNKVRHIQNSIFTTPAFVFILFGIVELIGFSGPIAALAFGVTMGNIVFFKLYLERKHVFLHSLLHPMALSNMERSFFSEVVFLLETFFFVYVGMSITFANTSVLAWGAVLVVLMFIVRPLAVRWSVGKVISPQEGALMSTLVPIGLAAAVLASIPLQLGIEGGQLIQEVTYAMILFSIVLTSMFIFLISKTRVGRWYGAFVHPSSKEYTEPSPNITGSNIEA